MSDIDGVSLKILTDWNSREYNCEGQKQASLQCLINTALEEQQKQIDTLNKVVEAAKPFMAHAINSSCPASIVFKFQEALAELKR